MGFETHRGLLWYILGYNTAAVITISGWRAHMTTYNQEDIKRLLASLPQRETPFLILDTQRLRENARRYTTAFAQGQVFFSVKANNHPDVLAIFAEEGIQFDVASWGEIQILSSVGVRPDQIIFSAPTKIPRDIVNAYAFGIRTFAFDSQLELGKLHQLAPGCQVIARVTVDNLGSHWPLERKFGLEPERAVELMVYAASLGLLPYGLTFHVGSQNSDPQSWLRGLERMHKIWVALEAKNISLKIINTGGGFPAQFEQPVPSVEEIAVAINATMQRLFQGYARLIVEPGRGLVGNAGIMAASVINRTRRGEETWLYLDVGAFHGLIEGIEMFNFQYNVLVERTGDTCIPFVLSGPTCDSADTFRHDILLPAEMTLGDRVFLFPAGAYSNSLEHYNGMQFPDVILT
jgi:ornithine decarboxylase